jgi:hypothetical protein
MNGGPHLVSYALKNGPWAMQASYYNNLSFTSLVGVGRVGRQDAKMPHRAYAEAHWVRCRSIFS